MCLCVCTWWGVGEVRVVVSTVQCVAKVSEASGAQWEARAGVVQTRLHTAVVAHAYRGVVSLLCLCPCVLQRVRAALQEEHDPSAVRTSLLLEDDPTYK